MPTNYVVMPHVISDQPLDIVLPCGVTGTRPTIANGASGTHVGAPIRIAGRIEQQTQNSIQSVTSTPLGGKKHVVRPHLIL
jgi:hypothetical protein